jgi:hypothetical protein
MQLLSTTSRPHHVCCLPTAWSENAHLAVSYPSRHAAYYLLLLLLTACCLNLQVESHPVAVAQMMSSSSAAHQQQQQQATAVLARLLCSVRTG